MRQLLIVTWLLLIPSYIFGEEIYTLDSLRHLALQNNKTLIASKDKIEAANYENKSAKSSYLPSLSFDAGYIHNQKSIHLLSDDTKQKLNSLGVFCKKAIYFFRTSR